MVSIGIVQMSVQDGRIDKNLARAAELVGSSPGADIYLLPELFTTGYAHELWPEAARRYEECCSALSGLAVQMKAAVAGGLIAGDNDGMYNRMTAFGPDGALLASYDKIHLFRLMREDRELTPGGNISVFDYRGLKWGMAICYDLRFPAMFQQMAAAGAEIILVASEWPFPRCDSMDLLTRARAVENQCFVALSNRAGASPDGTEFCGGSMLASPLGEITGTGTGGEKVVIAGADPAEIVSARALIDALSDRRPGIDGASP